MKKIYSLSLFVGAFLFSPIASAMPLETKDQQSEISVKEYDKQMDDLEKEFYSLKEKKEDSNEKIWDLNRGNVQFENLITLAKNETERLKNLAKEKAARRDGVIEKSHLSKRQLMTHDMQKKILEGEEALNHAIEKSENDIEVLNKEKSSLENRLFELNEGIEDLVMQNDKLRKNIQDLD